MHSIEDLADWKRCFLIGGMGGHSNPTKMKRKTKKEKELKKRQMLVHKFINDEYLNNLVTICSEKSNQIRQLNFDIMRLTHDIEGYLENKGGEEYIGHVDSGYNSNRSFHDSKKFYEEWKLFYNIQ